MKSLDELSAELEGGDEATDDRQAAIKYLQGLSNSEELPEELKKSSKEVLTYLETNQDRLEKSVSFIANLLRKMGFKPEGDDDSYTPEEQAIVRSIISDDVPALLKTLSEVGESSVDNDDKQARVVKALEDFRQAVLARVA
jgi:hypothetical protein